MSVRQIRPGDRCEFKGCKSTAEDLVYDRHTGEVRKMCEYHSDQVVDKGCPEYTVYCPNCGCNQGVN